MFPCLYWKKTETSSDIVQILTLDYPIYVVFLMCNYTVVIICRREDIKHMWHTDSPQSTTFTVTKQSCNHSTLQSSVWLEFLTAWTQWTLETLKLFPALRDNFIFPLIVFFPSIYFLQTSCSSLQPLYCPSSLGTPPVLLHLPLSLSL